jgi:hypothetical protein
LADLLAELESYPAPEGTAAGIDGGPAADLMVPMRLSTEYGELALFYTSTAFGSPRM